MISPVQIPAAIFYIPLSKRSNRSITTHCTRVVKSGYFQMDNLSSRPGECRRYVSMRLLLVILLLLNCGCRRNATQQEDVSHTRRETHSLNIDGGFESVSVGPNYSYTTQFYTQLSKNDFAGKPIWRTGDDNPPLSAYAAMVAASKYLDSLVGDGKFPDGAHIDEIELNPFDPDNGQWYYVVRFKLPIVGGTNPFIGIAVLMDGTVLAPGISDRIDIGWPLPNAEVADKPKDLTDTEILKQFISNLNPNRVFAGQTVEIIGRMEKIEWDHPHRNCGQRFHLILNDGTRIIFDPPGGWAIRYNVDLRVTGQLVGYRDLSDRQSEWNGLDLVPGIRPSSIGVVRY